MEIDRLRITSDDIYRLAQSRRNRAGVSINDNSAVQTESKHMVMNDRDQFAPKVPPISLVRSTPPAIGNVGEALSRTLSELANNPSSARLLQEHRFGGTRSDKEAASKWLERRFREAIDPDRIIVMGSAQNAMAILLSYLTGPGDGVAVEELSYHGLRMIAGFKGNILHSVGMDDQGAIPSDLERIFREKRPKLAFLMPTLHNPTTAIMSEERRLVVADIARDTGIILIEDDVYGGLVQHAPRPIAALAPDVTWHLTSFAKTVGPGVRIAYVVAPTAAAAEHLVKTIQGVSYWFPTPIAAEIAQRWITDGTMLSLCESVRQEAIIRQSIAAECLAGFLVSSKRESLFSWVKLPVNVEQARLIDEAAKRGITLRSGQTFEEKPGASEGYIRLVVGSPDTREDLRFALENVADIAGNPR